MLRIKPGTGEVRNKNAINCVIHASKIGGILEEQQCCRLASATDPMFHDFRRKTHLDQINEDLEILAANDQRCVDKKLILNFLFGQWSLG